MPDTAALATFVVALLVLNATPGPDMMLVLARGVGQGRRTALLTVVGMSFVAGVVQVGLLVLGLAALLKAYPFALAALQWVGAAYMLYLGVKLLASTVGPRTRQKVVAAQLSDWSAIRTGAINSLTNPKVILFMFAFLPQFVSPAGGPIWLQLLMLGCIQKLVGYVCLSSVALASGVVGQWLNRWPDLLVWQQRFTGFVMVCLGVRLLVAGGGAGSPAAIAR